MNPVLRSLTVSGVLVAAGVILFGLPATRLVAQQTSAAAAFAQGKTSQGYPYLHGGVGSDEREVLKGLAEDYNLQLTFAEKRGPYLAGINVSIADAKGGEIVAVTTDGPFFYIQLPPGNYRITASFNGVKREIKQLAIAKGKTVRHTLIWDLGEQSPVLNNRLG